MLHTLAMATKTLLEETLKLLKREKNLMELARRSKLGYFWLRKFKGGKIQNPGVRQIEILHKILSSQ